MIPRISQLPQVSAEYKKFLTVLKSKAFSGDIEDRYPARLLCATDNSVYQCLPAAVIFPKTAADIALALTIAGDKEFSSIIFAPRGGGTGTNGQSLNKGIMIDCSRYMKEYRDFNAENREITVQAGVIKDELNEFLKYETSPITTQALVELKDYKRKIEEQTEIIKNLQAQLNKIEKEKEALLKQQKEYELQKTLLERKVWDEKSKRQKAEFQLERKTNQVLFLQSLQTLDIDSMNRYYHTIGVEAAAIQNWLTNINERLAKGTIDDKFLHRFIVGITHANERILSISRFATKANINMEGESRSIDIISFVEQYINNITKAYSDIEVEVHNLTNNVLIIEFKPIEISILLDNIVNNSIKAGAKHLDVLIQELSSGDIEFRFSDDGAGLDPNIENPDDLFEKGYTTTNGSGIGLYDASNIVKKLTGYIFVNKTYRFSELKKGFELIIILKR